MLGVLLPSLPHKNQTKKLSFNKDVLRLIELNFDFYTKIKLMLTPFEPVDQNVFVQVGYIYLVN